MYLSKEKIKKLIERDKDTYELVYRMFYKIVVMFVDATIRNKEDAKDITSEIFINLPETTRDNYDIERDDYQNWLLGVARNKCKEYFRKNYQKDFPFIEEIENKQIKSNEENKFRIEDLKDILTINEYRVVIFMYVDDLTLKEISDELNVGIFVVRKLKRKAFGKIKLYFKKNYIN